MSPQLLSGAARLAGSSLLRVQSDERLVALVRDGHDPAFTAVVERYRGELLRYTTRLVGESRAEDVVQQAFVNAHGAITSSDSDLRMRPWLYRIAHNAALNTLRAGRRTEELDERMAATTTVDHDVETRERLRDALAAIALLPEPQRDALVLQAVQGRSHEEIADALGVSAGAARQHVHRARGAVRAVVSAITPYGLLARFAVAGGGEPGTQAVVGAGAGAGAAATVAKIGAGVLAAGAIATGTTGHVPLVGGGTQRAPKPAVRHVAPAGGAAAPVSREVAVSRTAGASTPASPSSASGPGGRRRASGGHGGRGRSGESESRDDGGRRSRGDDRSGSDGREDSADDDLRSGSDGKESSRGDDDGRRGGSGSSGDDDRSGSRGSGSSGSDD